MGLEAIIGLILQQGINVAGRIYALIIEWKAVNGEPTPEQSAAIWERVQKAEERFDAAHAARHTGDIVHE